MRGSPPKHAPYPPGWISKPLSAMVPDELEDLRAALCRESPPDGALLRAIDGQLARHAASTAHTAARPDPDESDDWAWAH
ncbi:hypothetical protein [Actinomadura sp. SCN-SB]|uniref:hypothetical protein n=1 Tax=Actinomadura sp. SCN-SB TaxID=3373092 RepID=UPI00375332C6